MKICIATDFHLSYRQYGLSEREDDFYKQYDKLIDDIIKEKPNIFIELGDIYDESKPKPKAIKNFNDGIKKLVENNIQVIGILGNHTLIQRKDFYPVDFLTEDIKYLDGDFLIFDNVFIGGIGYHSKFQSDKFNKKLNNLIEKSKDCKVKILLLHQGLKEDIPFGWDFESELFNDFDYVFLGHIHKRITRKSNGTVFHYVGSLNCCNATEFIDELEQGKGYSILNINDGKTKLKSVNLTPNRPFINLNMTEDELNDSYTDEVLKLLKGYSIKPIVYVKCNTKRPFDIYEMCKKWERNTLYINKNITKIDENFTSETKVKDILSVDKTLKEICDEKYGENSWQGDFAVELKNELCKDLNSASNLADEIYEKYYKMKS